MAQISELLKALQQGNGGFTQPQSPFQLDAPAPAAPPTVGPTVANAAALPQAPSPAGAMPETYNAATLGAPDFDKPYIIPQAAQAYGNVPVNMPSDPLDTGNQIAPAFRTAQDAATPAAQPPNALLDLAEREGALGPKLTDIFSGRETAIAEGGTPEFLPQPTSVAGQAAQAPAPQVAPSPAAAPTPQAPQAGSGGLISFDTGARAGQTFFGDETGVGAVTQGNAAQIERGFDDTFGTRSAGDISITGPEGQAIDPNSTRYDPSRLTPTMQANVDAGRPPNVSAAQVQQAQTEAVARQATYEQGQAQDRIDRGMKKFMFDNRNATPEQQAKQQALLIAQENALRPEGGAGSSRSGIPGGDLSIRDQIALSKEGREQRGEQRELAEIDAEERQSYAKASSAAKSFVRQFENVSEIAADVKGQAAKPFTTGIGGMIMSLAAGTTASDMRANISTLQADSAFSALSAMRAASKTGGALGAISEGELKLLGDSQRALGADQSDEQLRKNVTEYVNLRNSLMQQAREAFAADYGQAKADEIFGGGSSEGSPGAIPNDRDSNTQVDAGLQQYFN